MIDTSATAVNQKPAILRLINQYLSDMLYASKDDILDYGSGPYDYVIDYFKPMEIRVWNFDPFHFDAAHSALLQRMLETKPADMCICSNVLNVLKDIEIEFALSVIDEWTVATGPKCFTVYEGNKTGKGKITSKGYQRNMQTSAYLPYLRKQFGKNVQQFGKLLVANG